MKFFILTFGCQMNTSDSQKIAALLQGQGHRPIKAASSAQALKKADIIVLNACSVRQSAIDRVYGKINNLPDKKIIVAGCLSDFDKKRMAVRQNVSFWHPDDYFDLPPLYTSKLTAYVPIMTGCNNFCSYCVVPFTRGREKSRPTKDIIAEIKLLTKNGVKEIVLIGQNVNSYKSRLISSSPHLREELRWDVNKKTPPSPSPSLTEEGRRDKVINFAKLLKTINALPGDFRISFLTSHPKDISDELITTMAKCGKLVKEIHLPVQSGDNQVLKKMNRHYTVVRYKNLIKKIRQKIPGVKISTDIIIGFPGETKRQFANTVKLAKSIKFNKAFIAKYSPRQGTAAAKLKDDVSATEKTRRWRVLDTLINKFEH